MKTGIVILFLCLGTSLGMAQERSVSFEPGDFSSALTKAKQQDKLLFIDFYTEWCAPCKQMFKEVFTKNEVADYFNKHFISIKVDADKEDGSKLSSNFQIKAYPTFVIIDAKGGEVYRISGAFPYDQFLAKIEKGVDPKRTLEVLQVRYAKGERSRSLIYDYIFSLLEKKEEKLAKGVMDDYYNSLSDKKKMNPGNFFLYDRYFSEDTLNSPKIRFLFSNKEQFYKTVGRNKVEALMYEWLETELFVYALNYNFNENHFDKAAFAKLEDRVQEAALTDREDLTALFKVANARVKGDPEQYVDACKTVFPHLNKEQRLRIMINLGGLRDVPERKVREKAIDLLGNYFAELKGSDVQIIKWVIADLEGPS